MCIGVAYFLPEPCNTSSRLVVVGGGGGEEAYEV